MYIKNCVGVKKNMTSKFAIPTDKKQNNDTISNQKDSDIVFSNVTKTSLPLV